MIYLFKKTVFNCQQATLLSIRREEGDISLFQRLQLSYHLLYCGICRKFVKHSHEINVLGKMMNDQIYVRPPYSMAEEKKTEIARNIELLS